MHAALLAIGDELLAGRTQDSHLAYLAPRLAALGVHLVEARTVSDDAGQVQLAVWELQERRGARLVITTGGLGPTHDDRTVAAIANLHGVTLSEDAGTWRHIQNRATARGRSEPGAGARRMALVPRGAMVFPNDAGAAPGLAIERALRSKEGTAWTLVLPGVPEELHAIWSAHAAPFISMLVGDARRTHSEVELECHAREADIAALLGTLQAAHPDVRLGSYPRHADDRIILHLSGTDESQVEAVARALQDRLRGAGVKTQRSLRANP